MGVRAFPHARAFALTRPAARETSSPVMLSSALTPLASEAALGFALVWLRQSGGWPMLPVRVLAVLYIELFRRKFEGTASELEEAALDAETEAP